VTSTVHDPMELLRNTLEERFQWHTDRLTELTVYSRRPDLGGYPRGTLTERIATSRRAITDTAQALRRMAEGTYGRCERCTAAIPLHQLQIMPHTRHCARCRRTEPRSVATVLRLGGG
jgi:DnaK suppressor protein